MSELQKFKSDPKSYHEEAPPCDVAAFRQVLQSRRSIRRFTPEIIPEEVTRDCLALALEAPSSSNMQTWEFHWVRTPELKSKIAHACLGQPAASTAAELIVCLARPKLWRRNAPLVAAQLERDGLPTSSMLLYYRRLVYIVYSVGFASLLAPFKYLLFSAIGLFRPIVRGPLGKGDLRLWAVKSAALACENLMLAFRAHGYDSCPMEGFDKKRVRRALRLPRDAEIVMIVSAGRRAKGGVYGPKLRLDSKLFLFER